MLFEHDLSLEVPGDEQRDTGDDGDPQRESGDRPPEVAGVLLEVLGCGVDVARRGAVRDLGQVTGVRGLADLLGPP